MSSSLAIGMLKKYRHRDESDVRVAHLTAMNDVFILVGIIAAWVILQRWILPRLGVRT